MAELHQADQLRQGSSGRLGLPRMIRLLAAVALLLGFTAILTAGAARATPRRPHTSANSGWKIEPTPNHDESAASINLLSAVSCTSGRACTAVGSYAASLSSPSFALAERWNGAKWHIQPTILPKGASGSELRGVSCTSRTACAAVGYSFDKTAHRSVNLAEAWNGTRWRIQAVPNPKGSEDAILLALSCSSLRACTAVGFYANTAGQFAMAERWNGRAWRLQALPRPATTALYGVSCSAANSCVTVGHDTRTGGPFAEAWNGTTWRIQTVPLPHGSNGGTLAAVSCTSSSACTATGGKFGTTRPTLAERWNGIRWAPEPTPNPADITTTHQEPQLNGVSCRSASACTASGEYAPGGHSAFFLETWSGRRWRLVNVPHPAGFASGALNGVSCVYSRCTAVGAWSGGPISIATLAMAG